jgi:membrane protease YdiL (CAAX protease family)
MRKTAVALTPVLVGATMYPTFQFFARQAGLVDGYFLGFLLYWTVWCAVFPLWVLGTRRAAAAFTARARPFGRPAWAGISAVFLPWVLGYGYAFPRALPYATISVVVLSAAISIVNAVLEELLWRAVFVETFGESIVLGWLYPAAGFACWHAAPLSIIPNSAPGGTASFLAASAALGLSWGWLARNTKSVRWTVVSHVLFDFSGLGGRRYV